MKTYGAAVLALVLLGMMVLISNSNSNNAPPQTPSSGEELALASTPAANRPSQKASEPTGIPPGVEFAEDNSFLVHLELLKQSMGREVTVRGVVTEYRPSWSERAPNIIYLRHESKELEIVYWVDRNTGDGDVPNVTQPGTPFIARGLLQNYRGRLQVKVEKLTNLLAGPSPHRQPRAAAAGGVNPPQTAPQTHGSTTYEAPRPSVRWLPLRPSDIASLREGSAPVLVYVRSERMPRSRDVENAYLLRPEFAEMVGTRTIYFLDVADSQGSELAVRLGFFRVPILRCYQYSQPERELLFTEHTTPDQVYDFLKTLPR